MKTEEALQLAKELIAGPRAKTYGDKIQNHANIAKLWTAYLDKVENINQSPIGKPPRSNPATYTGVFNHIRDLNSQLPDSKAMGYKPGRFSFNVKGGRCEHCQGGGLIKIEMHFLSDVYITCERCKGQRFNKQTLQIQYKSKNIFDILNMTIDEAYLFFESHPPIKRKLNTLCKVGLGYIKLGQPATQLSGGEAQRIKLASFLIKGSTSKKNARINNLHFCFEHFYLTTQKSAQACNNIAFV